MVGVAASSNLNYRFGVALSRPGKILANVGNFESTLESCRSESGQFYSSKAKSVRFKCLVDPFIEQKIRWARQAWSSQRG